MSCSSEFIADSSSKDDELWFFRDAPTILGCSYYELLMLYFTVLSIQEFSPKDKCQVIAKWEQLIYGLIRFYEIATKPHKKFVYNFLGLEREVCSFNKSN